MGLRGWRLFGVAGTILAYIAGILFLSVINMQNPHPKRARLGRFGEINSIRTRDGTGSGMIRHQPIQWCRELRFLNGKSFNYPFRNDYHHRLVPKETISSVRQPISLRYKKVFHLSYEQTTTAKTPAVMVEQQLQTHSSLPAVEQELQLERPTEKYEKTSTLLQHEDQNNVVINPHGSELTALASFPGSGNTWLRYLLQQATGILTGSIYKDYGLLKSGFPAESISNKSVLVVKTHEWGPNAWRQFNKAILLLRDPEKAILAEFNRQSGGHVGFASPDRYKRTRGRYWQQFVANKLIGWENMNLGWAKNFTGNLIIIFYDDLVADVDGTLRKVLNFLSFPIEEDLIACALTRKEGIFRRKKRVLPFDPYSPAMKKYINDRKLKVYAQLGRPIV